MLIRFLTSTAASGALAMARSVLLAAILQPAGYGALLAAVLVANLAQYLHLGIPFGLQLHLASGKDAATDLNASLVRTARVSSYLVGLLAASIALVVAHQISGIGPGLSIVVAILTLTLVWESLLQSAARGSLRFSLAAGATLLGAALRFVASFLAVPLGPLGGLLSDVAGRLGTGMRLATQLDLPARERAPIQARHLKALLDAGAPIVFVSLAQQGLVAADRIVIVALIGTDALGLYGLAALSLSVMLLAVSPLNAVTYPNIARSVSMNRSDVAAQQLLVSVHANLNVTAMTLSAVSLLFLLVPYAPYLNSYTDGIPAALVLSAGAFWLGMAGPSVGAANALGRTRMVATTQAGVVAITAALSTSAVALGLGLVGVAAGSSIAFLLYAFTTFAYSVRALQGDDDHASWWRTGIGQAGRWLAYLGLLVLCHGLPMPYGVLMNVVWFGAAAILAVRVARSAQNALEGI